MILRVELRQVESSAMVLVHELPPHKNSEYRIENKSCCYKLFYKQKGIVGNKWRMLHPGQSRSYVWEDPFRPHKLLVHTGENVLSPMRFKQHAMLATGFSIKQGEELVTSYLGYLSGISAEQSSVVSFDVIG
eukprot:CAMPEP_0173319868 /NCGR_PEP_ID=MMETSP1143-20121109/28486_1 /TAXON_ID=483371 /ORGANISM="non described non described, Strain CCMP2298" /LENGTH=131 /DNA_ID=CAMNT_0014263341 /DNA_START=12 /DNA_END=404 /DNA_ORIENTATION=+